MGGLRAFGYGLGGAAALGAVATVGMQPINDAIARGRADAAKAHPDDKELQRPSDALGHNLDGAARIGLLGAGLLALPTAAGAAIFRGSRPFALGALGASLGAFTLATLGGMPKGGEGIGDYALRNLSSAGSALNAFIHWHNQSDNPKVKDHVPHRDAKLTTEPRPSAKQLREATLPLPTDAKPDMALARKQADAALARIDWSKPEIAVWVPGTGAHEMAGNWSDAVKEAFGDRVSQTFVDYPASVNFGPSVATGLEALRLVLAGIAEHGGDHRVTLAGHSQGAWVVGEAMSVPEVRGLVEKAYVVGHPGAAKHHYDRDDAKVMELNDRGDGVTFPMVAVEEFLAGMERLEAGDRKGAIADLVETGVRNPATIAYLAAKYAQPERWSGQADPHHYEETFPDAAQWLAKDATPHDVVAPSDSPRGRGIHAN